MLVCRERGSGGLAAEGGTGRRPHARPTAAAPAAKPAALTQYRNSSPIATNRDLDAAIWTQLCHLILDTDRWIPREDAPSDCTHAGCLNGDNPGDGFESVKWISAASLAVTVTDGRVLRVDLDPATGRPLRPVTTGRGGGE